MMTLLSECVTTVPAPSRALNEANASATVAYPIARVGCAAKADCEAVCASDSPATVLAQSHRHKETEPDLIWFGQQGKTNRRRCDMLRVVTDKG